MRVLIAEDNPAVREALAETTVSGGHAAETVSSAEDAAVTAGMFRPEILFIDAEMDGIQKLLKLVKKEEQDLKVYLLVKNDMNADVTQADGYIRKPFTSAQILAVLDAYKQEPEKRSVLTKIISRMERPHPAAADEKEIRIRSGMSYLFFEKEPAELNRACKYLAGKGEEILFITSGNVKAVKEIQRDGRMKVCVVSDREGKNRICGSKIGSLTGVIMDFIDSVKEPVIAIDDLSLLIEFNDINSVLSMIRRAVKGDPKRTVTLLASLRSDVSEKDKSLLLHDMTEYKGE